MFDMNEQIKIWRSELSHKQTLEKSDIDELENHLREEIEQLAASKLTKEEAFMVASHRLGYSDSLSKEFAKVNTSILWRKRLFRAGAVVLAWIILGYIGQVFSRAYVLLAVFTGFRKGYSLIVFDILSQVTFFSIVVFAFYFISKKNSIGRIWFFKIADSFRGKLVLFIVVLMIVVGTLALKTLVMAITIRHFNVQNFGQISMVQFYHGLIQVIFMPLLLLLGIILVRPSKFRKVEA